MRKKQVEELWERIKDIDDPAVLKKLIELFLPAICDCGDCYSEKNLEKIIND